MSEMHPELRDSATRGGPGRARSAATRQRLLEAGLALFAEHGPRAVTTHDIAARAGYASGTFYLHFKDKLALLRQLADDAASELERRLQWAAANAPDPAGVPRVQAEALVGFAEEQRELLRIVFDPRSEVAEIGARVLERLARGVNGWRLPDGAAEPAPDCFAPHVLAQAIVGMWARVLTWWTEDPSRATREEVVRTLTHFQIHGDRSGPSGPCALLEGVDSR